MKMCLTFQNSSMSIFFSKSLFTKIKAHRHMYIRLSPFAVHLKLSQHRLLIHYESESGSACPILCDPLDYTIHRMLQARILEWEPFPSPGDLPNPGLLHCRWILYQLSHKGSPRILEWVAYLCSSWSSWPRNWNGISWIAGGFFTNWAIREALLIDYTLIQNKDKKKKTKTQWTKFTLKCTIHSGEKVNKGL